MILLENSPQRPSSNQRNVTDSRRVSTSTISLPPPYEESGGANSSLIYNEKRRHSDEHPKALQESTLNTKEIYVEPPPEFSRIAAVAVQTLVPFNPMTVSVGGSARALDKGFSVDLPQSLETLHPFVQRDISEADWGRFMRDLRDCTALSDCTKKKALFIPIALGLGPGAFLISRVVKAKTRSKKLACAINLINVWNQYFFTPRRVEVILMRGNHALTISKSNHTEEERLARSNQSSASLSSRNSSSTCSEGGNYKTGQKGAMKLLVVPL